MEGFPNFKVFKNGTLFSFFLPNICRSRDFKMFYGKDSSQRWPQKIVHFLEGSIRFEKCLATNLNLCQKMFKKTYPKIFHKINTLHKLFCQLHSKFNHYLFLLYYLLLIYKSIIELVQNCRILLLKPGYVFGVSLPLKSEQFCPNFLYLGEKNCPGFSVINKKALSNFLKELVAISFESFLLYLGIFSQFSSVFFFTFGEKRSEFF